MSFQPGGVCSVPLKNGFPTSRTPGEVKAGPPKGTRAPCDSGLVLFIVGPGLAYTAYEASAREQGRGT